MTPGFNPETWPRNCVRSVVVTAAWLLGLAAVGFIVWWIW